MQVENVQVLAGGDISTVTLHLTAHHLILSQAIPSPPLDLKHADKPSPRPRTRESWIAYPMISLCTFRPSPPVSGVASSIRIRGRDFKFLTLNIEDDKQAREAFESIKGATCKLGSIDKLYAFLYEAPLQEKKINGWEIYDAKAEWKRQGISAKDSDKGWRISKINVDYAFSPTYPALLPVPTTISDNTLNYAGRYRSRVRIPVLTYLHPVNNCSITRCSQPMAGIRGARSIQDEKLVSACFSAVPQGEASDNLSSTNISRASPTSSSIDLANANVPTDGEISETERLEDELISSTSTMEVVSEKTPHVYGAQKNNLIVDARPTVNALAMQAVGLGSENMDYYKFATKVYLGIDNIHVMRESLNKVVDAIKDSDLAKLPVDRERLTKSNWLKHITGLLDGSALIARQVGIQHSHVLIHCSDGWDRTSQLSAISQLLLDPYYRTIEGFIVLIEKDWLSFGHMFQHRTGYLNHEKWFQTQNDALAGTAIQPGGSDGLENAFNSAKRFFNKNNSVASEVAENEGDMLPGDELSKARMVVKEGKDKEATKPKETSPVFHQFLDATYQLLYQHPTRFEFNERFLRRLLYHQYSCQYGTFLYNNEKSRIDAKLKERTESVWGYFLSRRAEFTNPKWDGGAVDDHVKGQERLLFPNLGKVRWWNEVYNRSDIDMNGPANTVVEKYLGDGNEKGKKDGLVVGVGVVTGVETAHAAQGAGTTRKTQSPPAAKSNGTSGGGNTNPVTAGLANLKDGIAGLTLGIGGGSGTNSRGKSPARNEKEALEVEMQ